MILSLLNKVAKELDHYKIPYMLSGSVAMGTYTLPRMTMDTTSTKDLNKLEISQASSKPVELTWSI